MEVAVLSESFMIVEFNDFIEKVFTSDKNVPVITIRTLVDSSFNSVFV